jgi:hypothetical protein
MIQSEGTQNMFRLTMFALILLGLSLCVGCTSSTSLASSEGDQRQTDAATCVEPENSYYEGTGHYAGYQWAEEKGGGSCDGSSESFNEGCEEYEQQESEYQDCEEHKKD